MVGAGRGGISEPGNKSFLYIPLPPPAIPIFPSSRSLSLDICTLLCGRGSGWGGGDCLTGCRIAASHVSSDAYSIWRTRSLTQCRPTLPSHKQLRQIPVCVLSKMSRVGQGQGGKTDATGLCVQEESGETDKKWRCC